MGGINSGTWYRWGKDTTWEQVSRLSISFVRQRGYLSSDTSGRISWNIGGEPVGSISICSEGGGLRLNYRYRLHGEEWESVSQRINIQYTSCNYGGERPWFTCGGCLKRVGVLGLSGKYFRCRSCCGLAHASSNESKFDRAIRKRDKCAKKVLNEYECLEKPKFMHRKTFDKLTNKYLVSSEKVDRMLFACAEKYGMESLGIW